MVSVAQKASPAEPGASLQAMKSANTKERLIEAAIRVLVSHGYAATTTPRVAAEAGLSRGAMLHHFDNGDALMRAVIAALHERRLRATRRSGEATDHDVHTIVHTYWKQLSSPNFTAFHELSVAARTDRGLAGILIPAQKEFHARRYALAIEAFPEWQRDKAKFDLAMSLSQQTIEGMAINRLLGNLDEAMVEPLLANLEQQIAALKPV